MSSKISNTITGQLDKLSDDDLKFIAQLIGFILETREKDRLENSKKEVEDDQPENRGMTLAKLSNGGSGGGYYEKKMINGCGPYIYYRWREGRRLKCRYIGKAR